MRHAVVDSPDDLLVGHDAAVLYLVEHRSRIGKPRLVGVEKELFFAFRCLRHRHQLGIRVLFAFCCPFLAALLQHPHAGDVLQQPRRTFYAAFVGEIESATLFADHRFVGHDTHEAPCAATEVRRTLAVPYTRAGGYRRPRVVACYRHYAAVTVQPCSSGYDGQNRSQVLTRINNLREQITAQSAHAQHLRVYLFGARIHHRRGAQRRVLAYHPAAQQVADGIGDEQYMLRLR